MSATKRTQAKGRYYTEFGPAIHTTAFSQDRPIEKKVICQLEVFCSGGPALLTDAETEPTVPHFSQNRPDCACYLHMSNRSELLLPGY